MNHTRTTRPLPDLPASTQGKSLGQVGYEAWISKAVAMRIKVYPGNAWESVSDDGKAMWKSAAQAVATEISRLHKEEVETKDETIKSLELTLRSVREHRDNAISRAESAEKRVEELEAWNNEAVEANKKSAQDTLEARQAMHSALARIYELERELKERTATEHLVDANKKDEPAWIEHDGGPCPLRDEEVEEWAYKFQNAIGHVNVFNATKQPSRYAHEWSGQYEHGKITHYRVLKWKPGYTATTITGPDGKVYTRHKPGDVMPCHGERIVVALLANKEQRKERGVSIRWDNKLTAGYEVIAWCYANAEPKAETVPLEAKDVPPLSCLSWDEGKTWDIVLEMRGDRWFSTHRTTTNCNRIKEKCKINRSIPLTGRWNPDAWEPCHKLQD